jgi:hypothetical protein
MAIAKAQTPDASALRLVAGLDLKHSPETTHLAHRPMADGPHSQGRSALPAKGAAWPNGSDGARRGVATRWRAPAPPAGMVIA